MKRRLFALLAALVFILILSAVFIQPMPAAAQQPQGTPQPVVTSQPSPNADDILAQAQRANDSAGKAVDSVNLILGFIQVAGIIIGGLVAATGALLTAAGIRTLREYSGELSKARVELGEMRDQLRAQADEIRTQSVNSIRALSLLQLGKQLLDARNLRSALSTYEEAYSLDHDNPATNYFLGHIYTQERQLEKGITHLERSLKYGGLYPPAEAALAYALRLQADQASDPVKKKLGYAEAERMFLQALNHDPAVRDINGESVYAVLGGLYKYQGRIKDAIDAYHAAESVTPQNSYPIVNLAMLHFMQGNVPEAETYFKRSITISARTLDGNPFDYWTRFDLTIALMVTGNLTEAKRHLTIAIQGLQSRSPLEIFLSDLRRMKTAPYPPANADELIEQAQQGLDKLTNETLESARS